MTDALQAAARIADELLFPHALEVDERAEIPAGHFDALAAAGLYGIAGPAGYGGLDLDARAQRRVRELLAGGCLTTAFVWAQHQGIVRRLRAAPAPLRDAWLTDLCAGRRRSGIVLAGLLPGPPRLTIAATGGDGGLVISGAAPAVSGWGYVDVLLVTARRAEDPGTVVYVLVDAADGGLRAQPRRLAALNGTRTVALGFENVRVAASAIVGEQPLAPWEAVGEGVRANGAFGLGVADRCVRLAGDRALAAEVERCRDALDSAPDGDALARARADASIVAMTAAAHLVAGRGSSALDTSEHAQRLAREAVFLLAFGQRPAIQAALLDRLRAPQMP